MKNSLFLFLILSNFVLFSQKIITGKITNEKNVPIDSVKVSVKDTNIYVFSNEKGHYSILVPQNRKIISFEKEGYNVKEVEIKNDVINITMTKNIVNIFDLSLEELLKLELKIASQIELPLRESPGIISVITKEEIKNAGCRDMIDVLRLIPGIEFGVDVQGVTSIIMRGNWAHEGKVLLMIDGLVLNELSYSTIQLGHHISVDQIERVEIIRGPGSAIYGGYAELGVINIITKDKNNSETFKIGANYGHMTKTFGHRNIYGSILKNFNNNLFIKFHSFIGEATRSEETYTDIYGNNYEMTNQSAITPLLLNFQAKLYDFSLRCLFDNYSVISRDNFDKITSKAYKYNFNTFILEGDYNINLTKKLTITPKFNFKYNKPWFTEDVIDTTDNLAVLFFNNVNNRYTGALSLKYDLSNQINILVGSEYYYEIAYNLSKGSDSLFWNNKRDIVYNNLALLGQIFIKNKFGNVTLGARVEKHSQFKWAFAPRLAYTKAFDNLHFKILLSQAFRSPGIRNIDLNAAFSANHIPTIKPEKLFNAEFEFGYKISDNMLFSTNLFYILLKDPIIYYIDINTSTEGYKNVSQAGSKGFEMEYKYFSKKINFTFNMSYYDTKNINKVEDYAVDNNENILLGAPQIKINAILNYQLTNNLNIYFGETYLSSKYGYTALDTNNNLIIKKFSPNNLINLFINYENFLIKNFNLGIGVYNILNEKYYFLQPYKGGHAPLPSSSREVLFKISYAF